MNMKVLVFIPLVIMEVIALALGWVIAFIHHPTAARWCKFYMRVLPDPSWYSDN